MRHYFLNEKTENGVYTINHFNTIEEAEAALEQVESATETCTFEEEGETVEMEVMSNTGDYYISTRPSNDYKKAHIEELTAKKEAIKDTEEEEEDEFDEDSDEDDEFVEADLPF